MDAEGVVRLGGLENMLAEPAGVSLCPRRARPAQEEAGS